jgi:hypothetical protein
VWEFGSIPNSANGFLRFACFSVGASVTSLPIYLLIFGIRNHRQDTKCRDALKQLSEHNTVTSNFTLKVFKAQERTKSGLAVRCIYATPKPYILFLCTYLKMPEAAAELTFQSYLTDRFYSIYLLS